jgi:PAS domain S-box-containing protein
MRMLSTDDTAREIESAEKFEAHPEHMEAVLAELGRLLESSNLNSALAHPEPLQKSTTDETLPSMEARYRVLLEQIPAVVFMAFLDGGLSEAYVSPQIEQMLGFSREEWLDDPIRWYHQIHPDDRTRWSVEAAEMFMSGKPLKSVYRVIARDGRIVWFHCEAKLVRRPDGRPWFIHGVGFDITELKQTEQKLQQESAERERLQKLELERQIEKNEQTESKLAAIVESSEDAIIGKTLEGIITNWNAAATRIFGYEAQEIIGQSILLLIPPERHSEELEILRRLKAGERIKHYDTERIRKNGERINVSLTISPIRDAAGQVIGASKIARDVTERTRMEEALRNSDKYAAMGRVAAVLAHEISNPLESVTNTFYMLQKNPSLDDQARELARIAKEELTRVNHIAKQTLGLYRQSDRPTPISLSNLLKEILDLYARQLQKAGISVETHFIFNEYITGFSVQIRQVFLNLISNAIQAMPQGGKLRIHLYRSVNRAHFKHRDGVRVNVLDTGIGIARDQMAKLFQPFFTTKAEKGTGLGLWVSRGIIEKLEGSIRARTCTSQGKTRTCFSVFIPTQLADRPKAA